MHTRTIGGFAFPRVVPNTLENSGFNYDSGMTLRDYFAAKAMQSLLIRWQRQDLQSPLIEGKSTASHIVEMSYEFADEMIKEREK